MNKFRITEQEKEDIMGQHKDMLPEPKVPEERKTLDTNLQSLDFTRLKNQGLTPYYYDSKLASMVELTKPVERDYRNKHREVYLLTSKEFDTIKKMSDNINEMIKLKLEEIELYKKYVVATANELVKKNK